MEFCFITETVFFKVAWKKFKVLHKWWGSVVIATNYKGHLFSGLIWTVFFVITSMCLENTCKAMLKSGVQFFKFRLCVGTLWTVLILRILFEKPYEPPHDKNNKMSVRPAKTLIGQDAQADLSLRWAQMPFWWFCDEVAQISLNRNKKVGGTICVDNHQVFLSWFKCHASLHMLETGIYV